MRLVSLRIETPFGARNRIAAMLPDGQYADLQSAYCAHLTMQNGVTLQAARRLSAAATPPDMAAFIENGDMGISAAQTGLDWIAKEGPSSVNGATLVYEPGAVRLLAPIPRPPLIRDFMAFEEHLKNIYPRLGREIPEQWYEMPVYYKGNPGSVGADGDVIEMPSYAPTLDFEFEFAAVIGRGGQNIRAEDALDHVFGYMIYNDFSARDIQQREMSVGLGPAKGKDFNKAHVFGPCLVTADEIQDVYSLGMKGCVNGELWCDTNTSTMKWRFEHMIEHASMDEHLVPGEIFGSGTAGRGSGAEVGKSLGKGDRIVLEVEGLGSLTNFVG